MLWVFRFMARRSSLPRLCLHEHERILALIKCNRLAEEPRSFGFLFVSCIRNGRNTRSRNDAYSFSPFSSFIVKKPTLKIPWLLVTDLTGLF